MCITIGCAYAGKYDGWCSYHKDKHQQYSIAEMKKRGIKYDCNKAKLTRDPPSKPSWKDKQAERQEEAVSVKRRGPIPLTQDIELERKFGVLVKEALEAFGTDPIYAVGMARSAKATLARREKWARRLEWYKTNDTPFETDSLATAARLRANAKD